MHVARSVVALICVGGALVGCGSDASRPPHVFGLSLSGANEQRRDPGGAHASNAATHFRFFSPTSVWNTPVPADVASDPSSAAIVQALAGEAAAEEPSGKGPWINTVSYSVPVYTVPANQPTVHVLLDAPRPESALQSAMDAVPLPSIAQPARGSDAELVVWQPSKDRLWEFWRLGYAPAGWQAAWGGAMRHVSRNPGVYGLRAWPGSKPWWGAAASSLPLVGGLITLEDLQAGQIDHALAMAVPNVRAGAYASPAQRDDGTSAGPLSLPEGAHLRLNPKLDLAALHLPPLTLMIAHAAQRYGIFVRDKGGNVQFFAQDPTPTGTDPFSGPGGYFSGLTPSQLLSSFPWSDLELLKLRLHPNGFSEQQVREAARHKRKPARK